ncbi:hypothetical protein [Pseudonocardia sp. TRM90224]|uniref:hypothetical protein n=1 Tax=Pseudonocardia sp. TRM90224 TaxID=2812678 RepID=UPI001E498A95|nr:hypothetical protein [Pseudonocardia sp. TRM90224]
MRSLLIAGALVTGALVLPAVPAAAAEAVHAGTDGTKVNGPYPLGICQRNVADARRQGVGTVTDCYAGYGGWYFTWFIP